MPNGLYMHSSNRLEELARMLAGALRGGAGADPLARDVVVVQTPGVARWLSLQLADGLGCCMNLEYLFPRNFVDAMCARMLGGEAPAHPDVRRLGWRIFALLPEMAAERGAEVLARYLSGGAPLKRYQLAMRLADLFDQYLVHRPELIAAWEAGAEPEDWQASLWRALAGSGEIPHLAAVFPRLQEAVPAEGSLPGRVFLFGLSTLPQLYVNFLQLLGRHVDVELYALAPSEEFWGDLQSRKASVVAEETGVGIDFGQPLLASMGGQGREFFNMLSDADFNPSDDCFAPPEADTTLARLQRDILHLAPRHEAKERVADGSIVVASSAGPMREMEALKDHILSLLDADATLRPRDILVLAPNISLYAPCAEAVFGSRSGTEPELPYALADRGVREAPLVDAFLGLLDLVPSRRTIRGILDFLSHPAVAERFGLDDEALTEARRMCAETGVRWGLDAQDREALGFGQEAANSWKAGMDSLVLGVMMAGQEECVFGGVAPYAEAEGDRVTVVAKLVAAFEAVRSSVRLLETARPLAEWPDVLRGCAAAILPETPQSAPERASIAAATESLGESAGESGPDTVDVATIRAALEDLLVESIAPHGFLSGGITFAELKPMRSVPARVICLIGMDDAAFPRQDKPLSFDRIRRQFRPGDRSARAGDRYLFLETLLCVRDHLYISYSGISPQGEADTPPSVVVTELLEYLEPEVKGSSLLLRHALQPFSPTYFADGPLSSYSQADCDAARRIVAPRSAVPFVTEAVSAPRELLALDGDALMEFLLNPSAFFLKNVLGMSAPSGEELPEEEEPLVVNALDLYGERSRHVGHLLAGESVERTLARTRACGILPWGEAGRAEAESIAANARVFANTVKPLVMGVPAYLAGDIEFGSGAERVRLRARLGPIVNGRLVSYHCAKLRTKTRLRAWISAIVAGSLAESGFADAGVASSVTTICRDLRLDVVPPPDSMARLEELLSLYREGLKRPLPVFAESSFAAGVPAPRSKKTPLERALDKWHSGASWGAEPECDEPVTRLVWRGLDPLEDRAEEFLKLADCIWSGYDQCAEETRLGV
jgi:exodeoxyribonuclease V gamma subunit